MNPTATAAKDNLLRPIAIILGAAFAPAVFGQQVTFAPYLQLGDNGTFGPADQIVIAWQTDEVSPNVSAYKVELRAADDEDGRFQSARRHRVVTPTARVVDNYLAADPSLPTIPGAYGPHSNYTAVLTGLRYDTDYRYRVTGPGLPTGGFASTFHTRKRGSQFSFVVVGDEGFYPTTSNPAVIVNFEARIAHLINNVANLSVPGVPELPESDLILDTGDNVYTVGSEDNYRDFFFPVWNGDVDSNEMGAPILRKRLFFPVDGNHDLGATGVSANLLADNAAPAFSGNLSGGDALSFFTDFYFPQNGPPGFDIQNAWNVDTFMPTGFTLTFQGKSYTSPKAIAAFRSSTQVDTGKGASVQIDHQSNYSFDYGNAHFLFLDANPHLFNDNLPGGSVFSTPPPTFVGYPTALGQWVINDLDSTRQLWKVVVFHQPAFSSGDATLANNQMRAIAKLLEDHGVNVVFNGHEHNYQRSLPIRATDRTAATPTTSAGSPAVFVDQQFDGTQHTVPDGVLYLVEGAGGNRDFDGDLAPPRGSGLGVDQDDSASGTHVDAPGLTVPQGPASWLDTNLTNPEMFPFFGSNAGAGTKITSRFKSKVFSFGDVLVDGNKLTLYQISEPLQSVSSATPADPAPFGRDINGAPLNDPIPDTQINPATGQVVSPPATGTSALLDAWTVTKPDVSDSVVAKLSGPGQIAPGTSFMYTLALRNDSPYALNGTQVRIHLPEGLTFGGISLTLIRTTSGVVTQLGDEVILTLGRLATGAEQTVQIPVSVSSDVERHEALRVRAQLHSATALPITTNTVFTRVR